MIYSNTDTCPPPTTKKTFTRLFLAYLPKRYSYYLFLWPLSYCKFWPFNATRMRNFQPNLRSPKSPQEVKEFLNKPTTPGDEDDDPCNCNNNQKKYKIQKSAKISKWTADLSYLGLFICWDWHKMLKYWYHYVSVKLKSSILKGLNLQALVTSITGAWHVLTKGAYKFAF